MIAAFADGTGTGASCSLLFEPSKTGSWDSLAVDGTAETHAGAKRIADAGQSLKQTGPARRRRAVEAQDYTIEQQEQKQDCHRCYPRCCSQ